MPPQPKVTPEDLKLLKNFRHKVLATNKPLSTRMYNQLQAAPTIPKKLKQDITIYYKMFYKQRQRGGVLTPETLSKVLWTQIYPPDNAKAPINLNVCKLIAAGGNGTVYECNDDSKYVYKLTSSSIQRDNLVNRITILNSLFKLPNQPNTQPIVLYDEAYVKADQQQNTPSPPSSPDQPTQNTTPSMTSPFQLNKNTPNSIDSSPNILSENNMLRTEPEKNLIYKMLKLTPIKDVKLQYYNSMIKLIDQLHKNRIIHCDLKIDNFMFYDYEAENKKIKKLIMIDFDGSIFENDDASNFDFTPIFAHPYAFHHYCVKKLSSELSKADIETVEHLRSVLSGTPTCEFIDHIELNTKIFGSQPSSPQRSQEDPQVKQMFDYNKSIFNMNNITPENHIAYMKFNDYYSLSVDYLIRIDKILMTLDQKPELKTQYETFKSEIEKTLRQKADMLLANTSKRSASNAGLPEGTNGNKQIKQGGADSCKKLTGISIPHLIVKNKEAQKSILSFKDALQPQTLELPMPIPADQGYEIEDTLLNSSNSSNPN